MRRLRFSAQIQSTTFNEFGDAARERRKRDAARQAANPMLLLAVLATMTGPDSVPEAAFDESVREQLFA
jgi:hypothetical protein